MLMYNSWWLSIHSEYIQTFTHCPSSIFLYLLIFLFTNYIYIYIYHMINSEQTAAGRQCYRLGGCRPCSIGASYRQNIKCAASSFTLNSVLLTEGSILDTAMRFGSNFTNNYGGWGSITTSGQVLLNVTYNSLINWLIFYLETDMD
jgi:hypothetical protein